MKNWLIAIRPSDSGKLRPLLFLTGTIIGLAVVVIFHHVLPENLAKILLDKGGPAYPASVQNLMWIAFCVGLAELSLRLINAFREEAQLRSNLLPEDASTILEKSDLIEIYKNVNEIEGAQDAFLHRLIERCILQFNTSNSVEQSALLMNTSVDLFLHEVDLNYNLLRFITWFIPSLGFIGTLVGISYALAYAGESGNLSDPFLLTEVTSRLATAFNSTLLALVMASLIVFMQNIVQVREERALNGAGQYCLDNLINRLFVRE